MAGRARWDAGEWHDKRPGPAGGRRSRSHARTRGTGCCRAKAGLGFHFYFFRILHSDGVTRGTGRIGSDRGGYRPSRCWQLNGQDQIVQLSSCFPFWRYTVIRPPRQSKKKLLARALDCLTVFSAQLGQRVPAGTVAGSCRRRISGRSSSRRRRQRSRRQRLRTCC